MADLDDNNRALRYLLSFIPSDITIKKDDIFYRDKYSEIINYIKVLLTNLENLEFNNYLKPNGTLLINVNPGTDIIDYLKLIASNYYLEHIELNNSEIIKTPNDFFKHFNEILENIDKDKELDIGIEKKIKATAHEEEKNEFESIISDDVNKKKLILINQQYNFHELFNGKSLLNIFINNFQNNYKKVNFINRNLILIWINYDYDEIIKNSSDLFKVFDLFIKIPILRKSERETVLRNFSEKNPNIVFDINAIMNYTKNWEVKDINQLIKVAIFKHFLNADLNDLSNEITDIIINLIESGEYIPSKILKPSVTLKVEDLKQEFQSNIKQNIEIKEIEKEKIMDKDAIINEIRNQSFSEFMLNQLYENAASKNYNELLLIIDKLNKKEPIEDNDRKLLAKYPFILNDSPNRAQIYLEKAKKRIDLMKQAFGK